jgi:hypothetical protein
MRDEGESLEPGSGGWDRGWPAPEAGGWGLWWPPTGEVSRCTPQHSPEYYRREAEDQGRTPESPRQGPLRAAGRDSRDAEGCVLP